jgi:hypothetical protein
MRRQRIATMRNIIEPRNILAAFLLLLSITFPARDSTSTMMAYGLTTVPRSSFRRKTLPIQAQSSPEVSPSSLSPLPPVMSNGETSKRSNSPHQQHRDQRRRKINRNQWGEKAIPEDIPRLSDVLQRKNGANTKAKDGIPLKSKIREQKTTMTRPRPEKRTTTTIRPEKRTATTMRIPPVGSPEALDKPRPIRPTGKPWRAGYYTSIKTQSRIKNAATVSRGSRKSAVAQATAVLQALFATPPDRCNAANLICALTLSAQVMGRQTNDQFRSLLVRAIDQLGQLIRDDQLSARQLCNAAWAIAKHYDRDVQLLATESNQAVASTGTVLGEIFRLDLSRDSPDSPAQRVDQVVDLIAAQLTSILRDDGWVAKEGELSMASWAYGILRPRSRPPGWVHKPRMGELPQTRSPGGDSDFVLFEQWKPDELENECGMEEDQSKITTDDLFDAIAEALVDPRDPSGENRDRDKSLRVRSCKWNELANVAWAFASHGRSCSELSQKLLLGIAREASRRLHENGAEARQALSRDIAQVVWSLGTLQADTFQLADGLAELVDAVSSFTKVRATSAGIRRPLKHWSCADIVQMALSLAHARIDDLPLLRALYEEALARVGNGLDANPSSGHVRESFRAWEVSVLLWAQARLCLRSPQGDVFSSFPAEAVRCLHSLMKSGSSPEVGRLGSQEQANVAWALTVLEEYDSREAVQLLATIFDDAAASCEKDGLIQLEHAHQLWQALFLLEDSSPNAVDGVQSWFREYLQDRWLVEKARTKMSSARHQSLSQTLNLMGVAHYNEHDEDIDVAIVLKRQASWTHQTTPAESGKGVKVAVEFDGPNHFTRKETPSDDSSKPDSPRALGHTVLKYRLLKKQGWTVVRVPYYEFDKIPFWASMERQRYLQRLLKTHANLRFSAVDVSDYKAPVPSRSTRFD